jgi:excisionase family DNA binding protein
VTVARSERARAGSNPASSSDRLLTVEQAAAALNVSPRFIRRLIFERRIAVHRLGRHVRLSQRDLSAFIERAREPAHPETPRGRRRP